MKWFKDVTNLFELKKEYKRLVMIYHTDRPTGNLEAIQEINVEYDILFPKMQSKVNEEANFEKSKEAPDAFKDIINKIINLEGIEIELCGVWIWVSGNTKQYKDYLNECGFFWAYKKQMWYWRSEEYKSKNRKNISIDEIREKYGSDKITSKYRPCLND